MLILILLILSLLILFLIIIFFFFKFKITFHISSQKVSLSINKFKLFYLDDKKYINRIKLFWGFNKNQEKTNSLFSNMKLIKLINHIDKSSINVIASVNFGDYEKSSIIFAIINSLFPIIKGTLISSPIDFNYIVNFDNYETSLSFGTIKFRIAPIFINYLKLRR